VSQLSQKLINHQNQLEARKADLIQRYKDVEAKGWSDSHPTVKEFDRDLQNWLEDAERFNWERDGEQASKGFMNKMGGNPGGQAGYDGGEVENKAVTKTVSPLQVPVSEYRGLYEAVVKRLPSYRIDCNHFTNDVTTKAPFAESGFTSGNLPPILMPELFLDLPYEPDRAFSHFKQLTAPEARAVEYIQHTGNANPAAAVAELGTKPDLGLELTTVTTPFVKIAAIASASTEVLQDEKSFMKWIPAELQRALIDAETSQTVLTTAENFIVVVCVSTTSAPSLDKHKAPRLHTLFENPGDDSVHAIHDNAGPARTPHHQTDRQPPRGRCPHGAPLDQRRAA
jgi:hypothetical protein